MSISSMYTLQMKCARVSVWVDACVYYKIAQIHM